MFSALAAYASQSDNGGYSLVEVIFYAASVAGLWKMFEKAGEMGWPAVIPFYNMYKMCDLAMGKPWYWLRILFFCIPVVGWIIGIYYMYQMYKAVALSYGKPASWAWGLILLQPIFLCILGFGDASYYGPMGAGDTRTSQAREAKTVNFDVIKNEPEQPYQDYTRPAQQDVHVEEVHQSSGEEDVVDFNFDQPTE